MRLLTVAFVSPGEFLAHYADAYPHGALFCGTRAELGLNEPVLVEISFPGLPSRALVRGAVVSLSATSQRRDSGASQSGAWVAFDEFDVATRDFVVGVARGELGPAETAERIHRRFPAELPVDCRIDELDEPETDRLLSCTEDLGAGGAFIRSPSPPPVGTRVSLVIGPTLDSGETFELAGQVAWVRRGDRDSQGFGVRFDPKGAQGTQRLRALLRRADETGRLEFAPPN
jgi:Tfp pilus assembly protein PilZ